MNKYALWFRWAVVVGILQDWFFALPGIFVPNAVLGVGGADPAVQPIWPALASLLLLLLSFAYIPGAIDPFRYAPLAALSVAARAGGVVFFFVLYPGQFPALFGYLDLGFVLLQGTLLALALIARGGVLPDVAGLKSKVGHWPVWQKILAVVVVLVGVVGFGAWYHLLREEPQHFDTMEEQFKYGSIGTEGPEGMPYWIWLVLPRMFPEYLPGPGGYASLGLVWEAGRETPVGFSKKTIGFSRIALNCALCHSGTYRTDPQQAPTVVPGAPATRLDVLGYQRFVFKCAEDERFNADDILAAIEYNVKLSALDRALYRHVLIPQTKKAILEAKQRFAWTESRPDWGRGRIDPFNPVKFHQLGMDAAKDGTIGNSDMQPLWTVARRTKSPLHWDGLNTSLTEVVLSGAIGDGTTPATLPLADLKKLEDWIVRLRPPKYPYPIDWELAQTKGQPLFEAHCASCHGSGGKRTGTVIPLDEVKTDKHRLEMWSPGGESQAAQIYNQKYAQYPWGFKHFVKTTGYVAVPLDGLWLRAPYLHNGSVPTLEDLLEPRAQRTPVFYRGYDVYDRQQVGFVHKADDILKQDDLLKQSLRPNELLNRLYFRYDTSVPGNGNGGHEGRDYGTELTTAEKRALIEYLKTQ